MARIFSDFSLKILWFSLRTSQNSNEGMKEFEGLFIENGCVKGNNSLTSALIGRFLEIPVDNFFEKMESHLVGFNCPITVQGSQ